MKRILPLFLAVAVHAATFPFSFFIGAPGGPTPIPSRGDAVAVWDFQTQHGNNFANVIAGATEYDLAPDAVWYDNTHHTADWPAIDSRGLFFKPSGANSVQAIAAGTGSASIVSGMTVYIAFERAGSAVAGTFGYTTLNDNTVFTFRSHDPEDYPGFHSGALGKNQLLRLDDGAPHLMAFVTSATQQDVYLDNCLVGTYSNSTTFPVTLASVDLSKLTEGFAGTVFYKAIMQGTHNASTRATIGTQIKDILAARSVTINNAPAYVLVEGDSISELQYAAVGLADQYHWRAITALSPVPPALCPAIHGDTISNVAARATFDDAQFDPTRINVLTVFVGTNDLSAGTSGASAKAALKTYCQARQAVGWKVMVCTPVARNIYDVAGFETRRQDYITAIKADTSFYDARADFGDDVFMGDPAQAALTVYFSDGVHPNSAGHARLGPIYKAALESLNISPPTPVAASINTAGNQLSVTYSASISVGSGGNTGATITPTGGSATVTYNGTASSGATVVYDTSRVINQASEETAVTGYTQPGNGLENASGLDVQTFSAFSVVNNSAQTSGGGGGPWFYSNRLSDTTNDQLASNGRFYGPKVNVSYAGTCDQIMVSIGSVSSSCNIYVVVYDTADHVIGAAFTSLSGGDANSEKIISPFGPFSIPSSGAYRVAIEESSNNDFNWRYSNVGTTGYMNASFNTYPDPFTVDGTESRTYSVGLHVNP